MLKTELITALSYNKECLSKQTLVPILSHFCLTPEQISSFNGTQGVVVDFNTGLNCSVPGEVFYSLLNSLASEELKFVLSETNVVIKAGKSTSKLGILPATAFVFTPPKDYKNNLSIEVTEDFIKGIKKCLNTVNDNPTITNQFGITLTSTALYSTDDVRISKYSLLHKLNTNLQYLLPKTFCELLCKFSGAFTNGKMFFGKDFITVEFDKVKLFTKVITDVKFLDYEAIIKLVCAQNLVTIQIPAAIKQIIYRCEIFLKSETDKLVKIDVAENEIEFEGAGKYGMQRESFEIVNIPNIGTFMVDIEFLGSLFENTAEFTFYRAVDKVVTIGKDDRYLQLLSSTVLETLK